jgi:outer membrane protein assembly factor BamA
MLLRLFLACSLTMALSACTTMVAKERLPYPLATEETGPEAKVVTIPLPVIASSPNEGITSGVLAAFLVHNKKDEITSLLAPQINRNRNFGTTFSLYGSFYPSPERSIELNLSQSTKVNNDYELKVRDTSLLDKKLELNAFVFAFADGSARFFGFQQSSVSDDETNYADQEYGFALTGTYPLPMFKHISVQLGERLKRVDIGRGAVTKVPFIKDVFSAAEVPGINGFTAHVQRLALVYTTLDSLTMPTFGGAAKVSMESSSRLLGGAADYRHYEAEIKGFVPADRERRYITAFRLAYNQTLGSDVPFLEQSILGGETSLRGYGRNRFIDSSYLLFNLEERIRVFRWEIFDVNADWEVAPFFDLGSVMDSLDKANARSFEFNPGLGLRAVVRPNIVGRIDVGIGKDGPAVFVGLGYPF